MWETKIDTRPETERVLRITRKMPELQYREKSYGYSGGLRKIRVEMMMMRAIRALRSKVISNYLSL